MTIMLQAQGAASTGMGGNSFLIMMVVVFAIMYFLMIRPQQKRQKELRNWRDTLKKGDKVITAGGIYGTVKELKDNYVLLDIDTNVTIRIDKSMLMKDNTDLQQQK